MSGRGKSLWEKSYKDSIDTFGVFNDSEVVVLNTARGQIEIVNLLDHTIRDYSHHFSFTDTASMEIHTFYDTRYLCIQEAGLIGEGKLVLTYYRYSSHSFEEVSHYKSKEGEWEYGNSICKANNHSKIAWWKEYFNE